MIMVLNVVIDGQMIPVNIPQDMLDSATGLFGQMDQDMNQGWTMGKEWVANPDMTQRCQIVGDKLLTAIEDNNEQLKTMMAGYILHRVPDIMTIYIDNTGDILETQFELAPQ